jgi:hypothetical protein
MVAIRPTLKRGPFFVVPAQKNLTTPRRPFHYAIV